MWTVTQILGLNKMGCLIPRAPHIYSQAPLNAINMYKSMLNWTWYHLKVPEMQMAMQLKWDT